MDVQMRLEAGALEFHFICDEKDGKFNEKIVMDSRKMKVDFKENLNISDIHPDHLALGIILSVNPFVGESLHINLPVSEEFRIASKSISRYKLIYPQAVSSQYKPKPDSRPGLSFSGGADSTAALLLMPKNTLSVFMDRPLKKFRSLYNKSAAYATVDYAKSSGYEVKKIYCDVEYVRNPIGFPVDLTPSIPLVLMARKYNLDSIGFGTVLESAYRVGHEHSREYSTSAHYRVWGKLFNAAGLPLYLPVSGISEVGTSNIVLNSPFYEYTRSCVRGSWPKSCGNCWKCFRKHMVEDRLLCKNVDDISLSKWFKVKEVKRKLSAWPVSHENVLSWSLQGDNTSGKLKEQLLSSLEGSERDMSFLTHWYPNSLELVPEKYREHTKKSILNYMDEMDQKDLPQITNHKMTDWLNSETSKKAKSDFLEYIKAD